MLTNDARCRHLHRLPRRSDDDGSDSGDEESTYDSAEEDSDDEDGAGAASVRLDGQRLARAFQQILGVDVTQGPPTVVAAAAAAPAPASERPEPVPMEAYYAAMDAQLAGTEVMAGFDLEPAAAPAPAGPPQSGAGPTGSAAPINDDAEGDAAASTINLDMNLVRNLLQSFAAQEAMEGPATTLLSSLRLPLPEGDLSTLSPPSQPPPSAK